MARRTRNHNPSIIANEIILEGPNSDTTARVSFEGNRLSFQNTRTGENLLTLDSENNQISFGNPIKLPDGTLLNTVSDVNVRDFELRASIPVVIYGANGQPKNSDDPVTITAILTGLMQETAVFTTNPPVELGGQGNTRFIYPSSFLDINKVDITATADEFSETITITKVSEGDDGITVAITNPSDIISAGSDGAIVQADLENTAGKFSLYKGATNLTDLGRVSYRVDDVVNISITINSTSGDYEVISFDQNADKGSATLVANYSGVEYTHTYRIVKAKAGQQGAAGRDGVDGQAGADGESPYVGIVTDENIFIDTVNNNNVANINSSALQENNVLTATVGKFEIYKGTTLQTSNVTYYVGTTGTNTTETKNNLTFTIDSTTGDYSASVLTDIVQEIGGWDSESEVFTVRALVGGITVSSRKIKIQKTKIGKDGKTGPSLKLNVSPALFRFNGEGEPVPNQVLTLNVKSSNLPDGSTIELDSEPALVFGENNVLSVNNFIDSEGNYLDSAVIKAQVFVDNEIYLEDFVTVFRTQNGTDAKSIVLSSDSQVFNFTNSDSLVSSTATVFVNIKTQNLTETISINDIEIMKNNGNELVLLEDDLLNNENGSYTLSLDFNSLGIVDKQTRDEIFPIKIRVDKQGVFDIISIHKLVGGDGALSGYLTNESDQIPAFADGGTQEEDYSTLNGNFKVFKGLEEVTDQCSFQVTYNENMTTVVNSNGFYSVTPLSITDSSNTCRAVIQASLGTADIQKVFTVTKTKQGKNTLNAIISNETHTIRAESNGNLVVLNDLNSAGGVVYVYDGNERVLSNVTYAVLLGDESATTSGSSYTSDGLTFTINQTTGVYSLSTTNLTSWIGNTKTFYIKISYKDAVIVKSYTLTKSKGGADAKLMTLRSNRMVFTFDSDNNASPAGQEIIFTANPTKGSVPLDTPITWSVEPSDYESLLVDLDPPHSKKKRILIEDFKTANIQDLFITAEADALEDSITIVKAKDGASGEDAKFIKVTATSMVVAYDTEADITPTPEMLTVFITQQRLSKILTTSDVIIRKANTTVINPSSIDSSGVNSSTKSGELFFSLSVGEDVNDQIRKEDFPIKIEVASVDDNVKDVLTINKISGGQDGIDGIDGEDGADGRNAVTAFLTNESHTAPAESNGFVSNSVLGDAGGSFEFYDGLTKITNTTGATDKIVFSIVGGSVSSGVSSLELEGLRIEINQSTGIYSLSNVENTSWSRNYQVFTIRAHYNENNTDYDKKFTISKSKEGQKGIDGADGADGLPGTNAKSVKLESDDYQIAYDVEGKNPQPATFTLTAQQQNHDNNDALFYFYEIDSEGNETLLAQGLNDIDNTRVIESSATKFITKKFRVKTKESSNGSFVASDSISVVATKDGADSITIVIPNDNHTFPADENGNITNGDLSLGGTEIEIYIGNDRLEAVDSETNGQPTVLEKNQFYVTKTDSLIASTLSKTDQDATTQKYYKYFVTLTPDSMSQDSANIAVRITARGSSDSSKTYNKILSYSKSRKGTDGNDGLPGSDGISPVNGVLTNESHTVVATNNGEVSSLAGSEGFFRVYRGQTEITQTSAVVFSVIGVNAEDELQISIQPSGLDKGKYTLTQNNWISTDSESFVLQALVDGTTVIQKVYTITKSKAGANGEPAKYLILESTKQSFDKKFQNDESVFFPDGQVITFTPAIYGFTETPTVTWFVDGSEVSNNTSLTVEADGTAKMTQDQFASATSNFVNLSTTIKAQISDGVLSYSDQITVILSQQGKDGSTGRDAKVVSLVADDYQIAYTPAGNSDNWTKSPSNVTLTATAKNQDTTAQIEYKFYINGTIIERTDNTINTYTLGNFESDPDSFVKKNIKVELVEIKNSQSEVVATDTITIFATREAKDGEPAVTISMPNSNHTFPASALGVVTESDYLTGTTQLEVYIGNTQAQPVSTSVADEDMQANTFKLSNATSVNISAGALSSATISGLVLTTAAPNSMTQKAASIEFEIKVKDQYGIKTFLQKQSFTRSERGTDGQDGQDGQDGANAKALFLLSDSEGFYINKAGSIVNNTISFSVIKENIDGNVSFSSTPPNLLTNVDEINGTANLTYSSFGTNSLVTVNVSADNGNYTDLIKIKKVESGIDGSNGTDAKVVKLESDDYQIAYDENGNNPDPTTITLKASQQNHAGVVYYRFTQNGSEIQNTTANTKQVTLPTAKFDSPISFKVETREGSSTGTIVATDSITVIGTKDGSNSYNIIIPNDNHTFVADENGQVSDYSGADTEVQVYIGNTALTAVASSVLDQNMEDNTFKVSIAEVPVNITIGSLVPSIDSPKYEIKNLSGMDDEIDEASIVLAITIKGKTAPQTVNSVLSYSKARKGATGTSAFNGYLTNESHILLADSEGNNYSLVGSNGVFEVFYGSQKLTSGVTYSVQGTSTKYGLTATIDTNGAYSFSGDSWSSDNETFTFRASYTIDEQQVNLDKIYSISKSKAGKSSISGYLTNETHTVQASSDGTYSSLGVAGGTFNILKGSENATGFSFSVDSTIKNNLTASINSTTGVYSFTGAGWNADTTSFTFTATSGSVPNQTVIQKVYTITKSKGGEAAISGYLTNETEIVTAPSSGFIAALNVNAEGGTFKVLKGTAAATGVTFYAGTTGTSTTQTVDNLTITINSSGIYTLSQATAGVWQKDSTTFTLRAIVSGTTITKQYKITKSKAGEDPLVGYLTNESHIIAANYDGTYQASEFDTAGGYFRVSKGSTDISNGNGVTYGVTQTIVNNLTASINSSTGLYSFSGAGWNTDTAKFDFTATSGSGASAVTLTKSYVVTKSKAGQAGINGTDGADGADGAAGVSAKLIRLSATEQAFLFDGEGNKKNALQTITFTANLQNVSSPTWTTVPDVTLGGSGNSRTLSITNFGSNTSVKVTVSAEGLSDSITVVKAQDGAPAKSIKLSSTSLTFTKDGEGQFYPETQLIQFTASLQNITGQPTWTVDGADAAGYMTITANKLSASMDQGQFGSGPKTVKISLAGFEDYATINETQDGSTAKAVFLYSDKQAFIKDGENAFSPASQVISFTASLQNIDAIPSWEIDGVDAASLMTITANKLSASINQTQFGTATQSKKITVSADGFSDSITVIGTKDGAAAKAIFLTSDKQNFRKDKNDQYYTNQKIIFSVSKQNTTEEIIWKNFKVVGSTETEITTSYLTNGLNGTKELTSGSYNTILGQDGTGVKIRAIGATTGLYDDVTIITIKDGADGVNGIDGLTGASTNTIFIRSSTKPTTPSASSLIPSGWSDDPPSGTNTLWASQGTKDIGETNFVWRTPYQVEGTAVAEISIYKKSSTTPSVSGGSYNFTTNTLTLPSGWSKDVPALTANGDKVYVSNGVFSGAPTQTGATTTWSTPVIYSQRTDGAQGAAGTNAKVVKLVSDDYQIAYDVAGNNPNGAAAGAANVIVLTATQQNHQGSVYYEFILNGDATPTKQNTTSNTYSYQLPATKTLFGNPKTFTVKTREGSSSGTVIASDSISIVSTKDGDNAFTVVVTNENHTFVADENNHVSVYTGGGTNIQVYYGGQQLTAVAESATLQDNQFKVGLSEDSNITPGSFTVSGNSMIMSDPSNMSDSADTAYLVLEIEVKGVGPSQTFIKTLSYSKSRKGAQGPVGPNGANAKFVAIYADKYFYSFDNAEDIIADPTSIKITISQQNLNSTITGADIVIKNKNGIVVPTPALSTSVTNGTGTITFSLLYNTTNLGKTNLPATIEVSKDGVSDKITIASVEGGSSARQVILSNESHTLPANSDGSVSTADYAGSGTDIEVFVGATKLNPIIGLSTTPNSGYFSIGSISVSPLGSITVNARQISGTKLVVPSHTNMLLTANTVTITYVIYGKDSYGASFNFTKTQTITKSIKGTDGVDGQDGVDGINGTDGVNGVDGQDGFDETIFYFSKFKIDESDTRRAIGWKSTSTNTTYQTDVERVSFADTPRVLTSGVAKFGGFVLEIDSNLHVYGDLIPVNSEVFYEFKYRAKKSQTTTNSELRFYIAHYNSAQGFISSRFVTAIPAASTSTSYVEQTIYFSGEAASLPSLSTSTTSSQFPENTKFIRILIYSNVASGNTFLIDYFGFKQSVPNLDQDGRIPERNSLNNRIRTSLNFPFTAVSPVLGDRWSVNGNSQINNYNYFYNTKMYDFSTSNSKLQPSYTNKEGVSLNTNSLFNSYLSDNIDANSLNGKFIKARLIKDVTYQQVMASSPISPATYRRIYTYHTEDLYCIRYFSNSSSACVLPFKFPFYGTIQARIYYTPLFFERTSTFNMDSSDGGFPEDSYIAGEVALSKWQTSVTNSPALRVYSKQATETYGTTSNWTSSVALSKTSTGETGKVYINNDPSEKWIELYKDFTITPTTSNQTRQITWLALGFFAQNTTTWTNHYAGWGITKIEITAFQPDIDDDAREKLYDLSIQTAKYFKTFTGQHLCVSLDNLPLENGTIVSSAGTYNNMNYEKMPEQFQINPQEAVPIVKQANKENDKSVIGVVCSEWEMSKYKNKIFKSDGLIEDTEYTLRYEINSLGEGGIWVTNYNGNLENGDYITSSPIPGLGMKQHDDILRNYTVAKITCDCNFDLESQIYKCEEFEWEGNTYRRAFVGCTYHCG